MKERKEKVIFECVCKNCSKTFHSKDQEMIFCPDCWNEYLAQTKAQVKGFFHYDEDLKKEIYEELSD